ncbi:universal stress protein [Corynebacterium uterequi]|uniref:Universal stress protein UspA-like protein n=1 Tax=Corynebacterium uterequi TaxID=1072256 RepID=A0A0G3HJP5_9CORY|nr:universal stress protein [Corynebacterium uterequi]AKK12138.1 universal stress protein UspA-like protein [Corynebacterium uterequi]
MNEQVSRASTVAEETPAPFGSAPLRVLIAWQSGQFGDEPINTAAWLARSLPLRVRAASTMLRLWPTTSLSKLGRRYKQWLASETTSYAKSVRRAFTEAGLAKNSWDKKVGVVLDGPSESTLLTEAAEEFDADLVIVGSHAAAPKGRFLSGTTTDSLLHSSPIPLALAPSRIKLSKRGVTRVNVALLDSQDEDNDQVLFFAGALAHHLRVPLRLAAFSPTGLTEPRLDERIDFSTELSAVWHEHALAMLDRVRDRLLDHLPDLEIDTVLGSGIGWAGAVDALKWKKGDLLCMGSTPSGPIERVFLGSTAAQFLPHVPVPVIIHPARNR